MAPGDRVTRIGLHADETGGQAALTVSVLECCGTRAFAGLEIGQKHRVVMCLHDDLVLKPGVGYEGRTNFLCEYLRTIAQTLTTAADVDGSLAISEQR